MPPDGDPSIAPPAIRWWGGGRTWAEANEQMFWLPALSPPYRYFQLYVTNSHDCATALLCLYTAN